MVVALMGFVEFVKSRNPKGRETKSEKLFSATDFRVG